MDRSAITFGQSEGIDPMPQQLKLREVSQEMRAKIWMIIDALMSKSKKTTSSYIHLGQPWHEIMLGWHVSMRHQYVDEYSQRYSEQHKNAKEIITKGGYVDIFNFIEYIARKGTVNNFTLLINTALERSRSPYRLIDGNVITTVTDQNTDTIQNAFDALAAGSFVGARTHLSAAGKMLTAGDWAGSIRESIHAVESVAKSIDPSSNTLGPALVKIEKSGRLNPNLKRGFNALYEYTSDEAGIRHALVDGANAKADEGDALYMFGACAAFVTYLLRKAN